MNEAISTTVGVLLAAGRGRRMGRIKQLLPWGDSTVVAAAFDGLARHCHAGIVLVVGDDGECVIDALGERPFRRAQSDSDAEQIESACLGLQCAMQIRGARRVLLHPADHPMIPANVITALFDRTAEDDRVLIPTFRARGGHPILIPLEVVASIISWHRNKPTDAEPVVGGLRGYWESHPQQVERVEFPDAPELVMDLDSPDDYAAALRYIE